MRENEYFVIVRESDLSKINTRGGDEDLGDGTHKVWYGNGFQTSGPLGENSRELTVEEDKTIISEILSDRGLQDFSVVQG